MDQETFAAEYDALFTGPRNRALFGDSGYFSVGYWEAGITEVSAACDRMVDELARPLPGNARVILDVGCGLGAGTRRLAELFPDALVIGANISLAQLVQASARGVEAAVVMDAAQLAVASGHADAVLAIESPQHFCTRAAFLAEAHRVLRPGGVLAVADMLVADREALGAWMLPPENQVGSLAEYGGLLAAAGFREIEVRDATDVCWRPFCAAMRAIDSHPDRVDELERSVSHYVLAFARKP
jgi:cyclopropane fatty-acyl-phospholipid synthase-like methyltransferase